MRVVSALCVVAVVSVMPEFLIAREDHHGSVDKRGAMVMGFDQELTTHHFFLFADGGAIDGQSQISI